METLARHLRRIPWRIYSAVAILLAVGFFFGTSTARAAEAVCDTSVPGTVTCDLYARTGDTVLPDGLTVPVWGYADTLAGTIAAPGGPTIVANEGDTLVINLHNELADATSLSVRGIADDAVGAAAGGSTTYTFANLQPGTYMYEAGLTDGGPRQVAMGLFGAIVVRPTGVTSAGEVLVLSEIDPAFNNNPATFDMTEYAPKYWLINGKAYPDTDPIVAEAGTTVLLRYLNAGLKPQTMAVLGLDQLVIADGASPLAQPYSLVNQTVAPGQTIDALITIPATAPGSAMYPLFNTVHSDNNGAAFGGMMTFIQVPVDTPPAVAITDPLDPAVVPAGLVTITAFASDNRGVTSVAFYADNGTTNDLIGTDIDGTDGWSVAWDTSAFLDGTPFILTAVATDTAGQTATSAPSNVTIDNAAPTATIDAPVDGASVTGLVTITATATGGTAVAEVAFTIDDGINPATTVVDTNGGDGWAIAWNTAAIPDGTPVTLTATATDGLGQTGAASAPVTVTVINTAPTVGILAPVNGDTVTGDVTITANPVDTEGLITKVDFFVSDTTGGPTTLIGSDIDGADGWSVLWPTATIPDLSSRYLTAVAYDEANQPGTSAEVMVTVSNPPPTVTLADPGPVTTGTLVTLTATTTGTAMQVEFFVDGVSIGLGADNAPDWNAAWDTTGLAGTYTLTAVVTDELGRTATSADVIVTVGP